MNDVSPSLPLVSIHMPSISASIGAGGDRQAVERGRNDDRLAHGEVAPPLLHQRTLDPFELRGFAIL